jgi:hypothetical protein
MEKSEYKYLGLLLACVLLILVPAIINNDSDWFQRSGSFLIVYGVFVAVWKVGAKYDAMVGEALDLVENSERVLAKGRENYPGKFDDVVIRARENNVSNKRKIVLTKVKKYRTRWLLVEGVAVCVGTLITSFGGIWWRALG